VELWRSGGVEHQVFGEAQGKYSGPVAFDSAADKFVREVLIECDGEFIVVWRHQKMTQLGKSQAGEGCSIILLGN
jgi:hypothetical protein